VKQLSQFAFAGLIGYFVDAGVLVVVYAWAGPYFGRLISFTAAVFVTWLINRSLTFRRERDGKPMHQELSLYVLSMLGGGLINVITYFCLVFYFKLSVEMLPVAVAIGSLAGMLVNFWLSKRFVFTASGNKDG